MKLADYVGRRFTLVLTDENDESVAYSGWVASELGGNLHLEREGGAITLEQDWLARIRPVDSEQASNILSDADFWLPLNVGLKLLEDGIDIATGMKWPS